MKYLVFAVFVDISSGQTCTHSKEMDLGFKEPENEAEAIVESICKTGLHKDNLFELFVFRSAQNFGDAPELVASWNEEDGLFGYPGDSEEEDS